MKAVKRKKVLFLCTGNSCRSQMAEGWAKHLIAEYSDAYSAGVETHGMNSRAIQVMQEAGVDLTSQSSKLIDEFDLRSFDYIITVCDHAYESCPIVPKGCLVIHKGFEDPPRLAENMSSEKEKLDCYRRVRDEIKGYIETLPSLLKREGERK